MGISYHIGLDDEPITSSELSDGINLGTVLGPVGTPGGATITATGSGFMINDALITAPLDVSAKNSVIHSIDKVLVPESFDLDSFLDVCAVTLPCVDKPNYKFYYTNKKGEKKLKGGCEFVAKKKKKRCKVARHRCTATCGA